MNYSEQTVIPPSTFSTEEKRKLIDSSKSQEEVILRFFRKFPEKKYHFYDIQQIFGFDKDSTKRALSNLSNRKPSGPWRDGNRETPILKLDEKRVNPKSGIRISLYQWNVRYGQKRPEQQASLFAPGRYQV